MLTYKEITAVAERKTIYPERRVYLPQLTSAPLHSPEHDQWVKSNWWMVDYAVFMGDKEEATVLAQKLEQAFLENPSHPDIPDLLKELKRLKSKLPKERTPLEYWTHSAYQLANYCGGFDPYIKICERLNRYSGQVLEAMCGHSTYFTESPTRDVIALDYCEVSLERYPFPQRRRIQCDLNQVGDSNRFPFFEEGQLDAISICFGFKYPEHIEKLVGEFRRILKPSGILSFVENPEHGYRHLYKRVFTQEVIQDLLRSQGFSSVTVTTIDNPQWDGGMGVPFYHVEAIK